MKNYLFFSLILLTSLVTAKANIDSIKISKIESNIKILENNLQAVRQSQLNYKIEKELLKEVYQTNFERINFFITIILGFFGVLGFLGIKNINSIKKEYNGELNEFRTLRVEFERKVESFNNLKKDFELEIQNLSNTNNLNNIKIQVLELKEKIDKLLKEDELLMALETVTTALSLAPNDITLLDNKSTINGRLGNYKSAIQSLKKAFELDPAYETKESNLIELYYFNNQILEAKNIIKLNPNWDGSKNEYLIKYLETIDAYHNKSLNEFNLIVKEQINKNNLDDKESRFDWDFNDAEWFCTHITYPVKENVLRNYIWYLKGDISGQTLLDIIDAK